MKARHSNVLLPWYKKWWGVLILAVLSLIAIIVIISVIYIINKIQQIKTAQNQTLTAQQFQAYLNEINGDGTNFSTGSSKPQVTIVEFGDFACPFCQESADGIRKVVAAHADKIKLVFRDYPLHDNSIDLALAARCAGEQGKFWETYDALYANQTALNATSTGLNDNLMSLAASLKLDTTKFSACLTEKTYLDQVRKDYEDGVSLEIKGTPTWFINNYEVTGALTEDRFQQLVSGLIK